MNNTKLSGINLYVIFRDLSYDFWVVILAFITGFVGVTTYFDYIFVPEYRSSMTVAVNVSESNVSRNISKAIEVSGIFQNIFQSDVMKEIVLKEVGAENMAQISAEAVDQTNLLRINAVGPDAVDTFKTLKAVYENYERVFAGNVFADVYINVVTPASVPSAPFNAIGGRKYALAAGTLLAALCAAVFVILSILRPTVKNQTNAETRLDAPFFGLVYHQHMTRQMKKKVRKEKSLLNFSVLDPSMDYAFTESIRRISSKVEYLKNSRNAKTFVVTSVDENEGKTTVAVNIALSLASKDYKVLLVDSDLRRPSVFRFFPEEMNGSYTEFGDYLLGKVSVDDIIKHDEQSSLDIINGKNSYRFAFELLGSMRYRDLIKGLYDKYDYIIIDTPPTSMTADAESIADVADVLLLVARMDRTPVAQINDTIDSLMETEAYFAGCILNDYRDFFSSFSKGKILESGTAYSSYYYNK